MTKPNVLTFCDYFVPGYKAGGPITTLSNMVGQLRADANFRIVTRDHDCGDSEPYPGIARDGWNTLPGAKVRYLASEGRWRQMRRLLAANDYDVLYLNSLCSYEFSIRPLLWRLKNGRKQPTIVAPRGELFPAALAIKAGRKRAFLSAALACGLHRDVLWQASAEPEYDEIRRWFGPTAKVMIAPDLAAPVSDSLQPPKAPKRPGHLRLVFLSRISPQKNLEGALAMLTGLNGRVEFTIAGPIGDETYWRHCQQLIRRLPRNIVARYVGQIKPCDVPAIFQDQHLMLLPTLGENFCHVVLESISAGCPVLISDRTPWRALESRGAGWDVPLDRPESFREILQRCVDLDQDASAALRRQARQYAITYHRDGDALKKNRRLLEFAYLGHLNAPHDLPGLHRAAA